METQSLDTGLMLRLDERTVTEYQLMERECHQNRANDKVDLMITPELYGGSLHFTWLEA